jgi:hypothetical protein
LRPLYLRFELLRANENSGVPNGIFGALYEAIFEGEIELHLREPLEGLYTWFKKNLKKPSRFNRSSSKAYHRRNTRGVSWIKCAAFEHIAKLRETAIYLRELGYVVNERITDQPGYIVYEDHYQIVAEPFRNTYV